MKWNERMIELFRERTEGEVFKGMGLEERMKEMRRIVKKFEGEFRQREAKK